MSMGPDCVPANASMAPDRGPPDVSTVILGSKLYPLPYSVGHNVEPLTHLAGHDLEPLTRLVGHNLDPLTQLEALNLDPLTFSQLLVAQGFQLKKLF